MKYIICGLEHSGLRVAEALLNLNEEVTIITLNKNESNLFFILNKIKLYVEGDARNPETLLLAGIDKADFFLIFTSNEIKNIEINCKAKEVNPRVKTSLLIKNMNYANIIEQGFAVDYVFHLPSIVSFPIVSACLNRNIFYTVTEGIENFYFGYLTSLEFPFLVNLPVKTIEQQFKIKMITCFDSEYKTLDPSDNHAISAGESFVYLTTEDLNFGKENFLPETKSQIDVILSETSRQFGFFRGFAISNGIRRVIFLYSLLMILSVFIFKAYLHYSLIDALYFVVTTTTTVGYGDLNLQRSPVWIKLYGCFLMIAGAALLATLFSVLTDNIISKRLGRFVSFYNPIIKNHIIIAGMGSIGVSVINTMSKMGIKMLVIEKNPENPNIRLLKNKIPVLIGDASEKQILIKAGIKKAKTLAALIDDDLNNINIILKGNALNPELHTVARIFSNDLHKKSSSTFQIDNVLSASAMAVPYFISNLIYKNIRWAGYINNTIYCLFTIIPNNLILHTSIQQTIIHFDFHLMLLERQGKIIQVAEDMRWRETDNLYIFGTYQALKNFILENR